MDVIHTMKIMITIMTKDTKIMITEGNTEEAGALRLWIMMNIRELPAEAGNILVVDPHREEDIAHQALLMALQKEVHHAVRAHEAQAKEEPQRLQKVKVILQEAEAHAKHYG